MINQALEEDFALDTYSPLTKYSRIKSILMSILFNNIFCLFRFMKTHIIHNNNNTNGYLGWCLAWS